MDRPMNTNTSGEQKAIRLTNAIDKFLFRRLVQLTASDSNAKERLELAERERENLQNVLMEICCD